MPADSHFYTFIHALDQQLAIAICFNLYGML